MVSEERFKKALDLRQLMLKRREKIFELRKSGKAMYEIAEELEMPESQVRYILTKT